MTRTTLAAALAVALLATSALGQEADAETRFHRAYEQEVVEGKLADAARVYLTLMDDKTAPERIRQESKFRFAVTAVLLGRSDEARVHLNELAKDTATPESLRARAAEYLDAAKGIGIGSELDRKLQSLVFDLAKDKDQTPAAYRDFEVIGKPAVPFLRKLLQHDDSALRAHAFRILVRMGEPGMGALWAPRVVGLNSWGQQEFSRYLAARPEENAAFEAKLLSLDDDMISTVTGEQPWLRPPLTAETLRALAGRKVSPAVVFYWFPSAWTAESDRVRGEWIAGADAELSAAATLSYLKFVGGLPEGNIGLRGDLFPAIVARLATMPLKWWPSEWSQSKDNEPARLESAGLVRLCTVVPRDTVLDTLRSVVERAVAAPAGDADPLKTGLVDALAIGYERRDANAPLPEAYAELLKTWFTEATRRSYDIQSAFRRRVPAVLPRLDRGTAESLAVWVVNSPDVLLPPQTRANAIPAWRATDVPVALAALRAADSWEARRTIVQNLGLMNASATEQDSAPEFARAIAPSLAEIVRIWSPRALDGVPIVKFASYMKSLPTEEARERFVEVALAVVEIRDVKLRQICLSQHLLGIPAPSGADRVAYWTDVVLPALPGVWEKLGAGDRPVVLTSLLSLLEKQSAPELRAAVGRFVAARYEEVPSQSAHLIAQAGDVFPVTEWVPRVASSGENRARVASERADPAVREMTKDATAVNDNVLFFASLSASDEVQTEVFDRLLRSMPVDRLGALVSYSRRTASAEAQEDALVRVLAAAKPDLDVVAALVQTLSQRRPSGRLFPALRLLLASTETAHVHVGIDAAKNLGRDDLLPELSHVLDSMDADLRQSAKEAIDAIVDLRKLKEEARRKADGR